MAIKVYKPVTPGLRGMTGYGFEEITKSRPERSLIVIRSKRSGRNNLGKVTVRHQGGGNRRYVRLVDFKRDKYNIPARVSAVEYDPNRTARLALLVYADGEKRYILAPVGLKVGDAVVSGSNADIRPGNCLPISNIPVGTMIHNVEIYEGRGGQLVRSAGAAAQLLAKEGDFAQIRMPSGEVRLVRQVCYATIGQVGNLEHGNIKLGKAGANATWAFVRPSAEQQCRLATIRMVVVKAVSRRVCLVQRARGANLLVVTRPAVTRRPINTSCAAAARPGA
jgi:large subunit ribosomal protein L2